MCFVLLLTWLFLAMASAPLLSVWRETGKDTAGPMFIDWMTRMSHFPSWAVLDKKTVSASTEDKQMDLWTVDFQKIGLSPILKMKLPVLFLVSLPAQSESLYPKRRNLVGVWHRNVKLRLIVPFKYLKMRFTATQWSIKSGRTAKLCYLAYSKRQIWSCADSKPQ